MNYDKYKNQLVFPQLRKQKFPEPKRKDYVNYENHGIAMDEWERNISLYDKTRPKIVKEYNRETMRLDNLFMDDLLDEFGWLHLSGKQRKVISNYLWTDANFKTEIYEKAEEISDIIYVLIEDE